MHQNTIFHNSNRLFHAVIDFYIFIKILLKETNFCIDKKIGREQSLMCSLLTFPFSAELNGEGTGEIV